MHVKLIVCIIYKGIILSKMMMMNNFEESCNDNNDVNHNYSNDNASGNSDTNNNYNNVTSSNDQKNHDNADRIVMIAKTIVLLVVTMKIMVT